ncbi:unnamed protein product [Rhizoctonia solani]|uniref:RING-type domain-containing protein n=1 Tax=Rhizoctonia solani TaxID=456999 RepID=A0A8H3DGT5_9AGAM|nr:unnamed protein product [Rhizoctonia solani]
MSDDEYFGDDDLFTSDVLDNIPALNQPPSPALAPSNLLNSPVQHPPPAVPISVPGSSVNNPIVIGPTNGPARAPGSQRAAPEPVRRVNSRFSTIMNALISGSTQYPGGSQGVFGPQTGLLHPPNRKNRPTSSQLNTYPPSIAGPSRISSQPSPTAGLKRRRVSSPARECSLESEIRADAWNAMEEELTCAICCDVFISPQLTHCGHSACAPCLVMQKNWLSKNNNCPICRAYINPNTVLSANRLASSMIDRMMAEATKYNLPDWCSGGVKEVEWKKRKRAWENEVAREAAAAQARNRIATRSVTATRHRVYVPQPLFLDDEDYDNYDYDDLGYEDEYNHY